MKFIPTLGDFLRSEMTPAVEEVVEAMKLLESLRMDNGLLSLRRVRHLHKYHTKQVSNININRPEMLKLNINGIRTSDAPISVNIVRCIFKEF